MAKGFGEINKVEQPPETGLVRPAQPTEHPAKEGAIAPAQQAAPTAKPPQEPKPIKLDFKQIGKGQHSPVRAAEMVVAVEGAIADKVLREGQARIMQGLLPAYEAAGEALYSQVREQISAQWGDDPAIAAILEQYQ